MSVHYGEEDSDVDDEEELQTVSESSEPKVDFTTTLPAETLDLIAQSVGNLGGEELAKVRLLNRIMQDVVSNIPKRVIPKTLHYLRSINTDIPIDEIDSIVSAGDMLILSRVNNANNELSFISINPRTSTSATLFSVELGTGIAITDANEDYAVGYIRNDMGLFGVVIDLKTKRIGSRFKLPQPFYAGATDNTIFYVKIHGNKIFFFRNHTPVEEIRTLPELLAIAYSFDGLLLHSYRSDLMRAIVPFVIYEDGFSVEDSWIIESKLILVLVSHRNSIVLFLEEDDSQVSGVQVVSGKILAIDILKQNFLTVYDNYLDSARIISFFKIPIMPETTQITQSTAPIASAIFDDILPGHTLYHGSILFQDSSDEKTFIMDIETLKTEKFRVKMPYGKSYIVGSFLLKENRRGRYNMYNLDVWDGTFPPREWKNSEEGGTRMEE